MNTDLKPVNNPQPIISENRPKIILKALLRTKGLNQSNLADVLNVDKALVSRIINSKEKPTIPMMIRIAKIFGVDSRTIWEK